MYLLKDAKTFLFFSRDGWKKPQNLLFHYNQIDLAFHPHCLASVASSKKQNILVSSTDFSYQAVISVMWTEDQSTK